VRRFTLFAECLTAGVLTVLAALPVVTLLAALAAGCGHIRAHVDGESTALMSYVERLRAAFPGSWKLSLGTAAAFVVLFADALILRAGVPGSGVIAVACVAATAMLSVLVLRAAAAWSPTRTWTATVRAAARHSAVDDPGGSLLMAMAVGVLAIVTWQLPPLVVPMLGCVLMAAVAVDRRAAPNPVSDPQETR
jgi:hypothetical protein